MTNQSIDSLLEIQSLDLRVDRLNKALSENPIQIEIHGIDEVIHKLNGTLDEIVITAGETENKNNVLEKKVAALKSQKAASEKKIYEGSVTTTKALESIKSEIEFLGSEQAEIEDSQLELMEQTEQLTLEKENTISSIETEETKKKTKLAELDEALIIVRKDLQEAAEKRSQLVSVIPEELLKQYMKLRSDFSGNPVARFSNGTCEGCSMALSAVAIDRMKKLGEGELSSCEECGRILVK